MKPPPRISSACKTLESDEEESCLSMRRSQSHSEDVAHAPGVVIDIPICAQLMLLQAGVGFLAAKSRQGAESVG